MLRGLAHAHSHMVAHTDLRPSKILYSSPNTPDVVDRGRASQPPVIEEALRYTYVVADFDQG